MSTAKTALTILALVLGLVAIGVMAYLTSQLTASVNSPLVPAQAVITYTNAEYGFSFALPESWTGYTVISETWVGNPLGAGSGESGPRLFIRHPKWTAEAPYEDLPILVFTTAQWEAYLAEEFAVGAAPIQASELGRNNQYVFALPARWDFDYSLGVEEARTIIAGQPLQTFAVTAPAPAQGKLNISFVCEQATETMRFADAASRATYIADCVAGKHPEVIEKYKADMNLGAGAQL